MLRQTWLRRTWAAISTEAAVHNYGEVRRTVGDACRIMAIVKADGYGHGAVPMAKAFVQAGAEWLGVSNLCEAIELREAGLSRPILILGYTPPSEAGVLVELNITQTVADFEYAEDLEMAAAELGVKVRVHIKADTGMSRLGFVYHSSADAGAVEDIAEACAMPHLIAEGLFTHFALADAESEEPTRRQFALFNELTERLAERSVTFAIRHCCNSAATVRFPEMHLDMVRPGLLLYGCMPDEGLPPLALIPAMTLKTVVAQVKTVPAGTPISYGATAVTTCETRLATVPVGYADGLPRAASNTARMMSKNGELPIRGRVCMDQCMLDCTEHPVQAGDEIVLFGPTMPVERLAAASQTISYEILCRVGQRVPRVY